MSAKQLGVRAELFEAMSDSINSDREENFAGRPPRMLVRMRFPILPLIALFVFMFFLKWDVVRLRARKAFQDEVNAARFADVSNAAVRLQEVQNHCLNLGGDVGFLSTNVLDLWKELNKTARLVAVMQSNYLRDDSAVIIFSFTNLMMTNRSLTLTNWLPREPRDFRLPPEVKPSLNDKFL